MKIRYIPPFEFSKGGKSKYVELTECYQKNIKEFLKSGRMLPSKEAFFIGLFHIAEYIVSGTEYFIIVENYEKKNQRDKIITAMVHRLASWESLSVTECIEKWKDDFVMMAENSVFEAAGLFEDRQNKRWNPDITSNFIRYSFNLYKNKLKEFLNEKMATIGNESVCFLDEGFIESEDKNRDIEEDINLLIEKDDVIRHLPTSIKKDIATFFLGELPEAERSRIQPYINMLTNKYGLLKS